MSNLVVKQHRPLQLFLAVIVLCLFLSTSVWFFLDKSHWSYIYSRLSGSEQTKHMWEVNRTLEEENHKLYDRVLMLERTADIDKRAMTDIKNQLLDLQEEYYRLKGELEFYQGIMESTKDSKGLNVQGLHVVASHQEQTYRYRLVLTNVAKSDEAVEGTINMVLEGNQDGSNKSLNFRDISAENRDGWGFKFKNFERFEGYLTLPNGFIPRRVTVQLMPKKNGLKKVERSFDWPSLTG